MRNRQKFTNFIILISPALILYTFILLWPIVNMFQVSTLEWKGIIKPSTFTGLDNYLRLLTDKQFHIALQNTALHMVVTIAVVMPLSFMLGFFLSCRPPGNRFLRTVFFIPGMLSGPTLAMIFLALYMPNGIINLFLETVGLGDLTRVWLANTETSLWAVIAVDLWGGVGWYAVMFYAALSNFPRELIEAAQLDGANYWQLIWKVALPVSLDFFGVMVILLFLWILTGAAQNVLLLTSGGPGNSSLTLGFYVYRQAFENRNLGYSQALGVFCFVIGTIGTLLIRRVTRSKRS